MRNIKLLIPVGFAAVLLIASGFFVGLSDRLERVRLVAQVSSGVGGSQLEDVLIQFNIRPGPSDQALIRRIGGEIDRTYDLFPIISARVPQQALVGLQYNPRVKLIEPNYQMEITNHDAELADVWGITQIKADQAHHDHNIFGEEINVAVLDTGIDYTHSDLATLYKGGYDFYNNDTDPMDDHWLGHGTHVAGTIAATLDGQGIVGAAPKVNLYGLKVLSERGMGGTGDFIAAIEWAMQNDIDITNNSYGGNNASQIFESVLDAAYSAGVLNVASAGNYGTDKGNEDNVVYPARYDSVIAVAGTDRNNERIYFSSTGNAVELSAPCCVYSTTINNEYRTLSGTSMASPHVVGVAALVMSAGITDPQQVRTILSDSAVRLGKGRHFGNGLVDAYAAVALALNETPTDPDNGTEPDPDPDGTEPTTVSVAPISFSGYGGPNGDNNLNVTVSIVDGNGSGVSGADVIFDVLNSGTGASYSVTSSTNGKGEVSLSLKNAATGCYETTVNQVTYAGASWDGETPANQYCK